MADRRIISRFNKPAPWIKKEKRLVKLRTKSSRPSQECLGVFGMDNGPFLDCLTVPSLLVTASVPSQIFVASIPCVFQLLFRYIGNSAPFWPWWNHSPQKLLGYRVQIWWETWELPLLSSKTTVDRSERSMISSEIFKARGKIHLQNDEIF